MRNRSSLAPAFVLAVTCVAPLGGCLPQRFVIDLKAGSPGVQESTVIADAGSSEKSGSKVALIAVGGFLIDGRLPGLLGPGSSPVDEFVARLERAERDGAVRAVILRINSPGGTVTGSSIMAREVRRFAERTGKPVVASIGEVGTSGGYYLAASADRIFAEPTSVTGSIGVIIQTVNVFGPLDHIGVKTRALTSGANKDLANPFTPEREAHYALLQKMVDDFYSQFSGWVIERRPSFDEVANAHALDGRVFTGVDAREIGLVDDLGGVREAFEEAKRLAGLGAARLVMYHADVSAPKSPYASGPDLGAQVHGGGGAAAQMNLVQINAPGLFDGLLGRSAGFYYLWVPPAP